MAGLDELALSWRVARDDERFRSERDGRRSPITSAGRPRCTSRAICPSARVGPCTSSARISHTRAPTRSTTRSGRPCWPSGWGSAGSSPRPAPASMVSPRRPPARCSEFERVVYMGTEDMRRQAPNVERMRLLGAEVAPVNIGGRTLKEAVSAAIRDWATNVDSTHYIIGSAVGPAPYPELVRDLQRVIGDESREQILRAEGRVPDRVIACVGGGSNAIGMFAAFEPTIRGANSSGSRPPATGSTPAPRRHRWRRGRAASCTARARTCSPTTRGRSSRRTRSRPGSTTRGWGPSTPTWQDTGRVAYLARTDGEALAAFRQMSRRGHPPRTRVLARRRVRARRARRGLQGRRHRHA